MTREEAIDLVMGFRYKPGWKWSITQFFVPRPDQINVFVTYEALDSTPNIAEPSMVNVGASMAIILRDNITAEEIEDAFFAGLALAEMHEMREYFRRKDFSAPFHPHRTDGNERWIKSGREQAAHTISRS